MDDFTIGGTLRLTGRLIARNAGALAILALLSVGVATLIGDRVIANAAGRWQGWLYFPALLRYLASIFLSVAVIQTVTGDETDRLATIRASFGLGFRLLFPVLAISLLHLIGTILAAILLIVPAIMLYCRWIAVIPASAIEGCGIIESFRRSAALTTGFRWRIFGLMLIFALIGGMAGGAIVLIQRGGSAFLNFPWLFAILHSLASCVTGVIFNVASVAIYLELRRTKEGALSPDLVAVFD